MERKLQEPKACDETTAEILLEKSGSKQTSDDRLGLLFDDDSTVQRATISAVAFKKLFFGKQRQSRDLA